MNPVKVELVGDGNGGVTVFVNGQPLPRSFYCEYSFDVTLSCVLEKLLCKNWSNSYDNRDVADLIDDTGNVRR